MSRIYFKKKTRDSGGTQYLRLDCWKMSHSEAIVTCHDDNLVGTMYVLQIGKRMVLFISTFCKINFGSINLNTELGQQATFLMVGREIRKHRLRALWIKGKNMWVRNLFSFFYVYQRELIQS